MNATPHRDDSHGELYTIETVEQITHVSRDRILVYQQYGLISTVAPDDTRFDDATILRLRRLSQILSEYGMNDKGLHAFASLMDEVERLREELRFLRR
jgi:DNA-binding transcriptional MerR regulator